MFITIPVVVELDIETLGVEILDVEYLYLDLYIRTLRVKIEVSLEENGPAKTIGVSLKWTLLKPQE